MTNHSAVDFFCSLGATIRHIFTGHRPDVLFYYPRHFNRSAARTNPYFDAMLAACEANKIRVVLLEEPDPATSSPRNRRAMRADALFWTVTVLRKIMRTIRPGQSFERRELLIARIIDNMTLHKFRARNYITISNSMIDLLACLNPKGTVYDLQHGIIYARHPGYFDGKGVLRPSLQAANKKFLVYGEIFQRCFSWNPENAAYNLQEKVHVIGYPIPQAASRNPTDENKTILYSLQFTKDSAPEVLGNLREMLDESLQCWENSGYKVLLKHHPRFNNALDLTEIFRKYPFAEETSLPLEKLVPQVRLHITYSSTTSFEYAAYGIPTYFLCDERFTLARDIFYGQYAYPLYADKTLQEVAKRIASGDSYQQDCRKVKEWYDAAYSPFDGEKLLRLLR